MSHWSQLALQNHFRDEPIRPETCRLLYPAYAFDDPHAFKILTRAMVYNLDEDSATQPIVTTEVRELLPYDVLGKPLLYKPLLLVKKPLALITSFK